MHLPALDAESTARSLEIMGGVHADLGVPATLFVCGRTLLHSLEAVQAAAGSGLFDVQQHTYSHLPFRDIYYSPAEGIEAVIPETPPVALREELSWTSGLIRRHTGGECGFRTPFGYYRGLRGRPDLLGILRDCGIRYVTSWGRNEQNANPTPWEVQPFTYDEEGFPELLELPFQFWLDGIWFDRHGWDNGAGFRDALKGAVDEIVERDLVYGVCFHEWVLLAAAEEREGGSGASWSTRKPVTSRSSYTDYWRRFSAALMSRTREAVRASRRGRGARCSRRGPATRWTR